MIERKDYFCPKCGQGFDVPARFVSPCCGTATNGGDNYECPECKQGFPEDEEIPECPFCGNIGDTIFVQPDHWDCLLNSIEYWESRCSIMETDMVGVENYLQLSDMRPDLFVADEGFYHFPCGECQHKKREREYCEGCRHFVT